MANTKIKNTVLDSSVISGQSTVTAASNDLVLIQDVSDSDNLKKALVSDFGTSFAGIDDQSSSNDDQLTITDSAVIINEDSDDVDFRVEGNGEANLLFVNAGDDRVGIGTDSPSVLLDIVTNLSSDTTTSPDTVLTIATKYASTGSNGGAGAGPRLEFKIPDDETNPITGAAIAGIKEAADDSDASAGMAFYISQNDTTLDEAVRIDHDGKVGIGETSPLGKLHVRTADSSGTADSGADELVLENSGDTGMTILSGTSNSGSIRFGDSDDNDNGIIIYNHGSSPYMRLFIGASEELRLTDAGNLHLSGGSDRRIQLGSGGAGANQVDNNTVHIRGDGANMKLMAARSGAYQFEINGSEVMRINSSGGMVIGTTNVNAPFDNSMLQVTQSTSHSDPVLALDSNNGDQSFYRYIRFYKKSSDQVGRLDADTSGSSMGLHFESDGRYKEVLGDADGMDLIEKLNPIKFKWLDGTGEGSQGFKAQEYKQAFNDVGSYARGVIEPEDESTEKWMLDYTHLMPNVIKALQELDAKITALDTRIASLEG